VKRWLDVDLTTLERTLIALTHSLSVVMPGLVPGTHVFRATKQGVGGRDKRALTPVFAGECPAMTRWVISCKRNPH
jgi:hypothetical protein